MKNLKNIYVLAVSAVLFQHVIGSASSMRPSTTSSSSSLVIPHVKKLSAPYLELLLHPKDALDGFFGNHPDYDDYEKEDLIAFAQAEARRLQPANILVLSKLLSAIAANPSQNVYNLIKSDPSVKEKSTAFLDLRIELLQKCLQAPTAKEAIRQLTIDALKLRLRKNRQEILQAFFSPLNPEFEQTKIEETIIWLIRAEQKMIRLATYYLTNQMILEELDNAKQRGIKIDIIVNKDGPKETLNKFKLPYKTWNDKFDLDLLMHHKFILFEKNIDGESILVNGSYNFTYKANRNHENIIVSNDIALFKQFFNRFDFIAKYALTAVSYEPDSSSYSEDYFSSLPSTSQTYGQNILQAGKNLLKAFESHKEMLKELNEIRSLDDSQLWDPSPKRTRND